MTYKESRTENIDPMQSDDHYLGLGKARMPSYLVGLAITQFCTGRVDDAHSSQLVLEQFYGLEIK